MAKRITRKTTRQGTIGQWWVRMVLAAVFIGMAYLFASLAIDSGSIAQYAIALIFVYWAFAHAIRGIRVAFAR